MQANPNDCPGENQDNRLDWENQENQVSKPAYDFSYTDIASIDGKYFPMT